MHDITPNNRKWQAIAILYGTTACVEPVLFHRGALRADTWDIERIHHALYSLSCPDDRTARRIGASLKAFEASGRVHGMYELWTHWAGPYASRKTWESLTPSNEAVLYANAFYWHVGEKGS